MVSTVDALIFECEHELVHFSIDSSIFKSRKVVAHASAVGKGIICIWHNLSWKDFFPNSSSALTSADISSKERHTKDCHTYAQASATSACFVVLTASIFS